MRKVLRNILIFLMFIAAIFLMAFDFWARFSHPMFTETMLFLTFWKQWLFLISAIFVSGFTAALLNGRG